MNLKSILGVILGIWLNAALGASYSNVYVQNGGSKPTGFFSYGVPSVYTDSNYARLSAPPIASAAVPIPSMIDMLPPCVSPCVITTNQNIAPVAPLPVTNNAKIIAYNTPNVPVVVAPSKDNGYEYSYVVYDENTGDQKAQRESSDGSVVRGEYSFIQPDGYVREVKYTADDLTGFNVVVKRIPTNTVNTGQKKAKGKSEPAPCADGNKGSLQVEPGQLNDNIELNEVDFGFSTAEPSPSADKTEATTVPVTTVYPTQIPEQTPSPEQPQYVAIVTPEETQASVQEITDVPSSPQPSTNLLVSYDDFIRCLQSSIQAQGLRNPGFSPLTYIILPGKPC